MPAFKEYHPGVGPYGEPQLVKQVAEFLNELPPYVGKAKSKRNPDLLIKGLWALEFKIARPFGDNGLESEHWSENLLHPYPGNVSVFGDCLKLERWDGPERKAAVVIGYEHHPAKISLAPLLNGFDALADRILPVHLLPHCEVTRRGLRHPVHEVLRVIVWELADK